MTEIEFHQERLNLIPAIITGTENLQKLSTLYYKEDPSMSKKNIDFILDYLNDSKKGIEYVSSLYKESEDFLNKAGIDINYNPKRTEQEWIEYEAWQKKFCKDPLRWRIPGWIRIPVSNFFKKSAEIKK